MSLSVAFFGTPAAAVASLDALLASHHRVVAVVTAPDRPRGRGMEVTPSPVKERALAAGLPVGQPRTLRDAAAQEELAALGADVFVVCAYGLLLPQAVLSTPRLGCINVHFSLLPLLRGAAPVAGAILAGLAETGVTIMRMDAGLDTGPMLDQVVEPIRPDDDTGALEARLAPVGGALLVSVLDRLEAGLVLSTPQDDAGSTYAAKLTPEQARIDWALDAGAIANRVRAFSPRPGAWTTLEGRRFKVWRATAVAGAAPEAGGGAAPEAGAGAFGPGPGGVLVASAGDGALVLAEVQPEGSRRMSGAEFLRGRRGAGGRFA